jgi:hypothetical protein
MADNRNTRSKDDIDIHATLPFLPNILFLATTLVHMRTNWTSTLRGKGRIDQILAATARPPVPYHLSRGVCGGIARCKNRHGIRKCNQCRPHTIGEWIGQSI